MSGAGGDAAAAMALVLPLAGLIAPLTGQAGRRRVVRFGRRGALAASVVWVVLVAAGAEPDLGGFSPAPATLAAAAATTLLAAVVARGGDGSDPAPGPALAPLAAGVVVLAAGLFDGPSDLGTGAATAWVLGGCAVAAAASAAAGGPRQRGGVGVAVVLAPAGLLVGLRASASVGADVADLAGVGAAALAAAAAVVAATRARFDAAGAAVPALLVAAVALAPVPEVRPWAALVAAGAALALTRAGPWVLLALAPGIAVVAGAAADVPAPGVGGAAHLAWALLALVAAAGLVVVWLPDGAPSPAAPAPEVGIAIAALVGWLAVVPGSWRWAVADPVPLVAWDHAAVVAVAAGASAAVLHLGFERVPGWPGRRSRDGSPSVVGR